MNNRLLLLFPVLLTFSCTQKETSGIEVIKFDKTLIDSLQHSSDTSYTEFIGRYDFYSAHFYLTYKDSLVTKVLKDSLDNVVGVNKSKNGVVFFATEYYPNGQLIGRTEFKPGIIDGPATYYYPDGRIKSFGIWRNYSQVGIWKNYSENGELKEIIEYNDNGDIISTETII